MATSNPIASPNPDCYRGSFNDVAAALELSGRLVSLSYKPGVPIQPRFHSNGSLSYNGAFPDIYQVGAYPTNPNPKPGPGPLTDPKPS